MRRGIARTYWLALLPLLAVLLAAACTPPSPKARTPLDPARAVPPPKYGHSAITSLAFSPDGRWLAAGTQAGGGGKPSPVVLWDLADGFARRSLEGHRLMVSSVAFSPDSQLLASSSWVTRLVPGRPAGEIRLWDPRTGLLQRSILDATTLFGQLYSLAFSPDGRYLASAGMRILDHRVAGGVVLWDSQRGEISTMLPAPPGPTRSLAFSPTGDLLATGTDGWVRVWDITSRELKWATRRGGGWAGRVVFSPDGQVLAVAGNRVRLFEARTGRLKWSVRGDGQQIDSVAFAPDGGEFASEGFDLRQWDARSGRLRRVIRGVGSGINEVAYSPDGVLIATGSIDDKVRLWEVRTGRRARTLRAHDFEGVVSR